MKSSRPYKRSNGIPYVKILDCQKPYFIDNSGDRVVQDFYAVTFDINDRRFVLPTKLSFFAGTDASFETAGIYAEYGLRIRDFSTGDEIDLAEKYDWDNATLWFTGRTVI